MWLDVEPRANDAVLTPPRAGRHWGLWVTSPPYLVAVLPCVLVLCASLLCCFLAKQNFVGGFIAAYVGVHSVVCRNLSFSQTFLSILELMQRAELGHKHIGKSSAGMLTEPNHRFRVLIYFAGGFCRTWVKADGIFNKYCQWSCPA